MFLKTTENKYWWGYGETGTLVHCWQDCKMVWRVLKTFNRTTIWSSNVTPGNRSRSEGRDWNRYVHTHVHSSVIPNSQRWKQPKCPLTEGWKNTTWYMHTMGYCSALNRKEIWTHDTRWMNLKDIILSEISQSQKDKYYIWFHLYVVLKWYVLCNVYFTLQNKKAK